MSPGIDHLVHLVPDLPAARKAAESLGFSMTPRGTHPAFGTANHLAMFGRHYWELLAVDRPGEHNAATQAQIEDHPGLGWLALRSDNPEADVGAIRAREIQVGETISFDRPVIVDGVERRAQFDIAHVERFESLLANFFLCHHRTPELIWRKEWLSHPNGVTGIADVVFSSVDPRKLAQSLSRMFGMVEITALDDGIYGISLEIGPRIVLLTQEQARQRLPSAPTGMPSGDSMPVAIVFRTESLARLRAILDANNVVPTSIGLDSLYVSAAALGRTALGFVQNQRGNR